MKIIMELSERKPGRLYFKIRNVNGSSVSGALSLILEAMPTLSPRDAAARLKETAAYDGLTTAGGCTIQTCTKIR